MNERLELYLYALDIISAFLSFGVDNAASSALQISSKLNELKSWKPEKALEHPAYSEIIMDEF